MEFNVVTTILQFALGNLYMVHLALNLNLVNLIFYGIAPISPQYFMWANQNVQLFDDNYPTGLILINFCHQSPIDSSFQSAFLLFIYLPQEKLHIRERLVYEANLNNYLFFIKNFLQPKPIFFFRINKIQKINSQYIFHFLYPNYY